MNDQNTDWEPIELQVRDPYHDVVTDESVTYVPYPYHESLTSAPNPYQHKSEIGIPPPPPKPPRKKSKGMWMVWIACISALILVSSAALFYWSYTSHVSATKPTPVAHVAPPTAQPTMQPTPQPTMQPTQTHLYTAEDIYNAFVTAGIGGTIDDTPDYWSCCLYRPEGGSERWQRSDGSQWEVASFINSQEAHDDTFALNKSMDGPGLATNIGRCILVSGPLSTDLIPKYETIMKKYC